MALHWLIAALLIGNVLLAWYFNTLHGLAQVKPLALHKSIGITVLLLTLVRVGWRLVSPPPPLPQYVRGWERALALTVQAVFYLLMLGMPLTGWAAVSASPLIHVHPTVLYGVIPWPAVGPLTTLAPDDMHAAHKLLIGSHSLLAKLAYAAIVLHVLGALKHQFIGCDDVVARMIPFLPMRRTTP